MSKETKLALSDSAHHLVIRSDVTDARHYTDYKEHLRHDFFASCAYCTMSESEAQARRFEIDHYEPVSARPDLEKTYSNLMYCCDECNSRKGDLMPPESAKSVGTRFFRPDTDIRPDHFEGAGVRLEAKSKIGEFSIEFLDLNRQNLRRLREIRKRLGDCDDHVTYGVMALRKIPLDRLPPHLKGGVSVAVKQMTIAFEAIADGIDELLRQNSGSPLIDPDPEEADRREQRKQSLKRHAALHPGKWRGRENR